MSDVGLIKVDENRFPPGWYTGDVSQWRIAKEDAPGARYKQFVFAVVREEENGYQEAYVLDRDQLRDFAENVDCDAMVTKDGAHSWRADIRTYGEPNMQLTGWIRTWNELEGFTALGAYWRRNQGGMQWVPQGSAVQHPAQPPQRKSLDDTLQRLGDGVEFLGPPTASSIFRIRTPMPSSPRDPAAVIRAMKVPMGTTLPALPRLRGPAEPDGLPVSGRRSRAPDLPSRPPGPPELPGSLPGRTLPHRCQGRDRRNRRADTGVGRRTADCPTASTGSQDRRRLAALSG
ncbi:hypothetical protein OHV13_32160 [Kitasatospora purpeofusca]|uniref:hypothetical protein n=1 Tax=Kitasatospora purpeofusca TaxID=67352 RepID=UPI003256946A